MEEEKMMETVKSKYLVSLVLAAILAALLLVLMQPAQAQEQADKEQDGEVGTATHGIEDISLDKSARIKVKQGRLLTYRLAVGHNDFVSSPGTNASGQLKVTDALPQGVQFVSVSSSLQNNSGFSSNFSCSGGATVTCESSSLFNGDSATITIVGKVLTRGPKVNTAFVQLLDPTASDPNFSNNSDTVSTRVLRG
jgi:hypothetical protein